MHTLSKSVPLGELGEIVSGSTPKTHVEEYWNGDIPWITPADLTDHSGIFFKGHLKKITKAGLDSCSTKILPSGSILFSSRAPIGHCAVTAFPLCTNQGFKSLVPDTRKIDPVYGFFALRFFTPEIVALGRGATFAEVNKEIIENFPIPLPPLEEQKRIAEIVRKCDRIRRIRRFSQQNSDTYLQSIFLEMFGDPSTNSAGWKVEPLSKHLRFITSGGRSWAEYYASEGARFIRSFDVQMNNISNTDFAYVQPPNNAESQRTKVEPGDVLLTITGSRIGRVAPVPSTIGEAYISQHVAILRLRPSMNALFVSYFLSNEKGGQEQIRKTQYGQTKPGLNFEQIRDFQIFVPPLPLQEKFAQVVKRFERIRTQQREAERQAEHLFQTVLHRAFRGEL